MPVDEPFRGTCEIYAVSGIWFDEDGTRRMFPDAHLPARRSPGEVLKHGWFEEIATLDLGTCFALDVDLFVGATRGPDRTPPEARFDADLVTFLVVVVSQAWVERFGPEREPHLVVAGWDWEALKRRIRGLVESAEGPTQLAVWEAVEAFAFDVS